MKNLYYIFILSLLLYSCNTFKEKKVQNELYSQDFKKFKTQDELVLIDLDSIENFSELRKEMGKIACARKVSGIKFNFKKTNYHMTGFAYCPTNGIGCYFGRNILIIKNDTLLTDFKNRKNNRTIENLKTELDSLISKPYNFQHDKNQLRPALIHLFIEDKYPISKTKKVLKEIAEQFESINSKNGPNYFQYHILFEDKTFFTVPPPPPPPVPVESE